MVGEWQASDMMLLKHVTNKDTQIVFLSEGNKLARCNQVARLTAVPKWSEVRAVAAISYYESALDHVEMTLDAFVTTARGSGWGLDV